MVVVIPAVFLVASILLFRRKKVEKKVFCLVLAGGLLGLLLTIGEEAGASGRQLTRLQKQAYGEGSREVELEAKTEAGQSADIVVEVPECQYDRETAKKLLEAKREELDEMILGENRSLTHVDQDLYLPTSFADSPITVEWNSNRPEVLDWEGIVGEAAEDSGTEVLLEALLTLQDQTLDYQRKIMVYPTAASQSLENQLTKALQELNQEKGGDSYRLPEEMNGQRVQWSRKPERTGLLLSLVSVFLGGLYVMAGDRRKEQEKQRRQEEMQREYPELVGKMQMFLSAGLTMRKIFERLTLAYRADQQRRKRPKKRWIYEETARTWYDMERGIAEQEAYERFGSRVGLASYKNLSVLLIQNLNKGGKGLAELLGQEAQAAFAARKRNARAAGEKAAVKLMVPMSLMLVVVLILVMAPALLSLGGSL